MSLSMIESVRAEHTGGGCMVDFILLKDGRLIVIDENCLVLYPGVDAFYAGDGEGNFDDFPLMAWSVDEDAEALPAAQGAFTHKVIAEFTADIVQLTTGLVIGVDSVQICLYASLDAFYSGASDSVLASISLMAFDEG